MKLPFVSVPNGGLHASDIETIAAIGKHCFRSRQEIGRRQPTTLRAADEPNCFSYGASNSRSRFDMAAEPSIRFLFRFRDLVGSTLSEHRKVIEHHGRCWWGWWKRPTEDDRTEVWGALAAEASAANPQPVGLFDSGSGQVYLAYVQQVIRPKAGQEEGDHPRVPNAENDLVPQYYRDSPFSFAWMKLAKIDDNPINFFGRYSFSTVPKLPNYSPIVLARFTGKVIVEPDELRGMDTTIWEVRPRRAGDEPEKILLSIQSVPEPISYQPILVKGNTILHITDLHYATGKHRAQHRWALEGERGTTMAEAILGATQSENIGLVILTGDLTFLGSDEEFAEASKGVVRLLGTLGLGTDNLIVIPGNHDIVWTQDADYDEKADVVQAPLATTTNYRRFYRALFRHDPNDHLSMGRRLLLSSGVSVEVAALNSNSLETGKKFLAGMGRVQESAFQEVANKLQWGGSVPSLSLKLLALHHHLTLTENLEVAGDYYRGFGIAIDAVRIQRLAAQYGVQVALHGHKHRAFIWRSGVYELPEDAQPRYRCGELSILGGGSAGSTETSGHRNYFNLLDVTAKGIRVRMFRSENAGAFQAMNAWQGKFGLTDGMLSLSEWEPE
jgi:predicted phosphodiesterase